METLMQLFGAMIFVYHCFDRIVVNGHLPMLSRSEQVVYFFKGVNASPRKAERKRGNLGSTHFSNQDLSSSMQRRN